MLNRIRGIAHLLIATASIAALVGCEDPPVDRPNGSELARRGGEPSQDWLSIDDVRSPTNWLIERSSGRDFVGDDPRVGSVDAALDVAERRFHENRRMLANRTAQLTDVSRENGETILPETILQDISFEGRRDGKVWFGVRAQAYIVLRQNGLNHEQAIADLKSRAE